MIYRKQVNVGKVFLAPRTLTFGFQTERDSFSVWHDANDGSLAEYIVAGTGHKLPWRGQLVQSCVMPDGFHVFHLVRRY